MGPEAKWRYPRNRSVTIVAETIYPMDEDWHHLIVLDACRYDYFERVYEEYLSGELRKVISPASTTDEWCLKVFKGFYKDVIYVSGNPRINSLNVGEFDAQDRFYKVIDIWNAGWVEERDSVPPEKVSEAALESIKKHPDKRHIIHYMQPHWPYLSLGSAGIKEFREVVEKMSCERTPTRFDRFRNLVGRGLEKAIGEERVDKLRNLLGTKPPRSPPEAVAEELGKDELRRAYENNLRIVLKSLSDFVSKFAGKTIVTSDHGELLGEGDEYSHPKGRYLPQLVEVPWLEVD